MAPRYQIARRQSTIAIIYSGPFHLIADKLPTL